MALSTSSDLIIEGLEVSFGGVVALDDVSLTSSRGEVLGVIGPNGAGKTTLFNVICGFVRPDAGSITFRGRRLDRTNTHDLTGLGIARTLQGIGLFAGLSTIENVMMGAQGSARSGLVSAFIGGPRSGREEKRLRERAFELLTRLDVAAYAPRSPATLPYGVQKRIALARALMAEPSMLLLDEPASGLSGTERDELASAIGQLRTEMCVLLVEHHMDLVMSVCDRLVVLNFGRVIATGEPEAIRRDRAVTTAYLGAEIDTSSDGAP